jgi:hypothetical protein
MATAAFAAIPAVAAPSKTSKTTTPSAAAANIDPDRRRRITLKCLELEEMLESQGSVYIS